NFAGFAVPLFAAQIKVTEQTLPTSSSVRLISSSESLTMVTTSAAGLTSSTSPILTMSSPTPSTQPMPTSSLARSDVASSTASSPSHSP
ncbi:hypothetical protein GBAR_LOCUS2601, partial [Geodia barretti]